MKKLHISQKKKIQTKIEPFYDRHRTDSRTVALRAPSFEPALKNDHKLTYHEIRHWLYVLYLHGCINRGYIIRLSLHRVFGFQMSLVRIC